MDKDLTTWLWSSITLDYYVMLIVTRGEHPIFGITFGGQVVAPSRLAEVWRAREWTISTAWEEVGA